ncbi:MAG: hypothetical protein VXW31_10645, partial [Planctomycetota bacterium]|nr:hypothetical protein [Planctomycetota bacterium]
MTDRKIEHNGRNLFLDRVRQVMELRDLDTLLSRGETRTRRRLVAARSDERTKQDTLKSTRRGEYGRAGKVVMRGEVARGTESTARAAELLFPDREAELANLPRPGEPLPAAPFDRDIFMNLVSLDNIKTGSAADGSGNRWEHIAWVVEAGGADVLFDLCSALWSGALREDNGEVLGMGWVFSGVLTCLRKEGDAEDQVSLSSRRKIRPIGIGSVLQRLVGGVGTRMSKDQFGAIFDPPTREDERAPLNAGVACVGGREQVQTSIADILAASPPPPPGRPNQVLAVAYVDQSAAFQNASRREFFQQCIDKTPGSYEWTLQCYGRKKPMYFRREDGSIHTIWCSAGTTQGDPFGPADHGLAQLRWCKKLQELLDAGILMYLDDNHVVGPQEVIAQFLTVVTDEGGEYEITANTGTAVNLAKSGVWSLESAYYSRAEFVTLDGEDTPAFT